MLFEIPDLGFPHHHFTRNGEVVFIACWIFQEKLVDGCVDKTINGMATFGRHPVYGFVYVR